MSSRNFFSGMRKGCLTSSFLFLLLCASMDLSSAVPTGAVLGIDLGSDNCVVAIARRKGVDIVANEASQRATPSVVSVSRDHRSHDKLYSSDLTHDSALFPCTC